MKSPLISVLMPVYNASEFVEEAITSVLVQSFENFELIIIDDCSTDDTFLKISKFSDPRIVVIRNEKNLRIAESLNLGIKKSQGRYIARMDADDVCFPRRLEIQFDFMEKHSDVALLGAGYVFFDHAGIESHDFIPTNDADLLKWRLLFGNEIAHPTVMFRKDVLEASGLSYGHVPEQFRKPWMPEDFKLKDLVEDYLLFGLMSLKYKVANLNIPVLKYRVHATSTSVSQSELQQTRKKEISLLLCSIYINRKIVAATPSVIEEMYNKFIQVHPNSAKLIRRDMQVQIASSGLSVKSLSALLQSMITGDVFHFDDYQKIRAAKVLLPSSAFNFLKKIFRRKEDNHVAS